MKDEPKLLPCPFCEEIPEIIEIRGLTDQPLKLWHGKSICILNESIVGQNRSKERLIELWNTRKDSTNAKAE